MLTVNMTMCRHSSFYPFWLSFSHTPQDIWLAEPCAQPALFSDHGTHCGGRVPYEFLVAGNKLFLVGKGSPVETRKHVLGQPALQYIPSGLAVTQWQWMPIHPSIHPFIPVGFGSPSLGITQHSLRTERANHIFTPTPCYRRLCGFWYSVPMLCVSTLTCSTSSW